MPDPDDLHEGSFIPENGSGVASSSEEHPPKKIGDEIHDSAVPEFGSSSSAVSAPCFVPVESIETEIPEPPAGSEANSAVALAAFVPLPSEEDTGDPVLVAADQNAALLAASSSSNELVFGNNFGSVGYSMAPQSSSAATAPTAAPKSQADSAEPAKPFNYTMLLLTWASLATLVAFWLWYTRPDDPSALDSIPDDGILSQANIISPLEQLSGRQVFDLGETKRVGALEITPLSIENRRVRILPDLAGSENARFLVLHLRIKNISENQTIRPMDPVFLYFHPRGTKTQPKRLKGLKMFDETGYTYTFIHPEDDVSKLTLPYDLIYEENQYRVEGQSFPKLQPGQETEVIVISSEDAYSTLSGSMVWRIKLRKQKVGDRGVATVIGVRFSKDDIKT